jgi:hypothetical protein
MWQHIDIDMVHLLDFMWLELFDLISFTNHHGIFCFLMLQALTFNGVLIHELMSFIWEDRR